MKLWSPRPEQGIRFAWLPVWTDEGKVWLEHVHFKWIEGWGWGSDGHYEYRRYLDEERYDAGARVQEGWGVKPLQPCTCADNMAPEHEPACRFNTHPGAQTKFFDYEMANGKIVPPDVSKCAERNSNEGCRYPGCTCMNVGGSHCPT